MASADWGLGDPRRTVGPRGKVGPGKGRWHRIDLIRDRHAWFEVRVNGLLDKVRIQDLEFCKGNHLLLEEVQVVLMCMRVVVFAFARGSPEACVDIGAAVPLRNVQRVGGQRIVALVPLAKFELELAVCDKIADLSVDAPDNPRERSAIAVVRNDSEHVVGLDKRGKNRRHSDKRKERRLEGGKEAALKIEVKGNIGKKSMWTFHFFSGRGLCYT